MSTPLFLAHNPQFSDGFLAIVRPPVPVGGLVARAPGTEDAAAPQDDDVFVVVSASKGVIGYCGHVDLGTGIRTALAQIIAEELDIPFADVTMVLGDTDKAPNQGATIASETMQISAVPLRKAAAQAKKIILGLAADLTGQALGSLKLDAGSIISLHQGALENPIPYKDLLRGKSLTVLLDEAVEVKKPEDYRVVGKKVSRVDIPDKVTGKAVYVHDVRVPHMVHGRVIRPPYGGFDHGPFVGNSLIAVDRASIAHIPGIIDVVVINDFVGIVAEREEQADEAACQLRVEWHTPDLPNLDDIEAALQANPSTARIVHDQGDVDGALGQLTHRMDRTYRWPYQMHASIGPSCAVAEWKNNQLTVWSGTQNPHMLRSDIAMLMAVPESTITIIRHEAAGCYGRNCADDVCGDAALLARAVSRPVRVQLTRSQEHVWEPKGAAQLMQVKGGLGEGGVPSVYDFSTRYPSNVSPLLALVLTGVVPAVIPAVAQMGDRTSIPPYDYDHLRVTVHDMPPIARASWFRGVSAMPNSFAHESYIDELAIEAGQDPVAYRLKYLKDERAANLLDAVARRAEWEPQTTHPSPDPAQKLLHGRGVAYALYVHGPFPGKPAAWSAWVADVCVDRQTGQIELTRVVVGQDSGMMINPAGVQHQIHGNIIQSISRTLREEVTFDGNGVASKDWGGYPLISFPEVPEIDVLMLEQQDKPPLGVGESASVPSAAAIANAVYAATGVRFRELPLTPEKVRKALDETLGPYTEAALPLPPALMPGQAPPSPAMARKSGWKTLLAAGAVAATVGGFLGSLSPWRTEIAPISRPDPTTWSEKTLEKGRQLAAAGDCAVCHTALGGSVNAGGLPLETPFGTIYTTNITPDEETGIGQWSYPAFSRAMREGVGRNGQHLYPAFPYTSFAKMTEPDMQALYAYLMAQKPVRQLVPETKLSFPYNIRSGLAVWKVLFHDSSPFQADPAQSAEWNRGAYLAEGLGHCSACHTPRNKLGAEKWRSAWFGGGEAHGWEAPPLGNLSLSPIPWTEDDLFSYLRTGFSERHGPATGPMAPVVAEMAHMPEQDVRAIATYVASFDTRQGMENQADLVVKSAEQRTKVTAWSGQGARVFGGSCAGCHAGQAAHMFGNRPQLALNTNIVSVRPDNLVRIILHGIPTSTTPGAGSMPAFADTLSDNQISDLVRYIRKTFAASSPEWANVDATVRRIRAEQLHASVVNGGIH